MATREENKVALEWIELFETIVDLEDKTSINQKSLVVNLKTTLKKLKAPIEVALKLNN